jgi:hypothetical protein
VIRGRGGARGAALAFVLAAAMVHAADVTVPGTSAKVETSGYVDGLAVAELGGPRQRPQAIAELSLLGKITREIRLKATFRSRVGGPFEGGHPGIMNFVHEFQNRTPSLEFNEAYAELRRGDVQLRAGIQKFAWGKLDGAPPTDVLTPRDLHDPLVRDFEESKIGIPAVAFTYYVPPVESLGLSELKASLAYMPIAVPSRIALLEERWFPPTIKASGLSLSERRANALIAAFVKEFNVQTPDGEVPTVSGPVRIPLNLFTLNNRPPKAFDAGGIAARFGGALRGVDWSISHYTGPETGPDLELDASARCRNCIPNLLANQTLGIRARSFIKQTHDTIHMTGADFSTVLGGATVRGEVAVFEDRPYLRISRQVIATALKPQPLSRYGPRLFGIDPKTGLPVESKRAHIPLPELFPDRDSVEWGIGADYLIEGFLPLLQVNQVIFTDDGPEQLLSNPETRLLASLRKRFLDETLEVELRGVYAFERAAWFTYPRITYRWKDNWRFRLGYLAIGGPLESMIGQFHANDEFTLEARYSF